MTPNRQKEQFSIAYTRAVAASAGFKISREEVDDDSIDVGVACTGGNDTVRSPRCDIQLKCTSNGIVTDDSVRFVLPLKNYNDLRASNLHVPRILVALLVPNVEAEKWLEQDEASLRLFKCAYWRTLRGEPETPNSSTVTVEVPRANVFGVDALKTIMSRIGNGGNP